MVAAVSSPAFSFCFHAGGGIGEYHGTCSDSIGIERGRGAKTHGSMPIADMEACYARCNCWTDFPDMGGQVTRGGSNGQVVSVSVRWLVSVSGGPLGGQVVRRAGWLFGQQVAR